MKLSRFLKDDLLSRSVDHSGVNVDDVVLVTTKRGAPVLLGDVVTVYRSLGAVHVKERTDERSGQTTNIFDNDLYSFVVLNDSEMTESVVESVTSQEGQDKADEVDKELAPKKLLKPEKARSLKPIKVSKDNLKEKEAHATLSEEDLDMIMSEVGKGLLKSLKVVGFREIEIYPIVVKAHTALADLLREYSED